MARIGVIGGGVAGMGAARELLAAGFEVTVVESSAQPGGNCFGLAVPDGRGGLADTIDAGVSDFNRSTFLELAALIDSLGLPTRPIGTDTHFASPDGRSLWACQGGQWRGRDGQRSGHGLDPNLWTAELARFRRRAVEVLEDERFVGWTLGGYLDHIAIAPAVRDAVILPRAMGSFPMPDRDPAAYDVRSIVAFWRMHGIVGDLPADRRCVVGGMHRLARAFAARLVADGAELRCGTRVLGVDRSRGQGVEVRAVDRDDRHLRLRLDHLILAGHPHEILGILDDPSPGELAALPRFPAQRARLVVHRDGRLAGDVPEMRGAFHYVVPDGGAPARRPTITFHPNRLAGLDPRTPEVFVTMNPHLEPAPQTVIAERFILHPVGLESRATRTAIRAIENIQGQRRTWYAGGYLVEPFLHESALLSGRRTAARLIAQEARFARRHAGERRCRAVAGPAR
jgi:predicted NAD/FAD-binding protein